ncbi:MAG: hypothetical protein LBQ10_11800 [Desulfovibrio sp.]|jgi:hypothetical protein|nr:hypothetical protein [Desulfovibrio sp.]
MKITFFSHSALRLAGGAIFFLVLMPLGAPLSAERVEPDGKGRLVLAEPGAEQVWQDGFLRVIYHTEGEDAVPPADKNANGVPDYVEDMARQFAVVHHIFCHIAGFPHPLDSLRYRNVSHVDIFVRAPDEKLGNGGLAFQEPSPSRPPARSGARSLTIRMATSVKPSQNRLAAHEYFHLIENGVTHLTNGWYFEGLADWARDAVAKIEAHNASWKKVDRFLHDPEGETELFGLKYSAAVKFWRPAAALCRSGALPLPADDPMLRLVYVDGGAVLEDFVFAGVDMVRDILDRLPEVERRLASEYGIRRWNRENRLHPRNDPLLLEAVRQSMDKICR